MSGQWPPEWEDPDDERSDAGLSDQDARRRRALGPRAVRGHLPACVGAQPRPPRLLRGADQRGHRGRGRRAGSDRPGAAAEPAGPLAAPPEPVTRGTVRSANPEEFYPAGRAAAAPRRPGGPHRGRPPRLEGVRERGPRHPARARGRAAGAADSGCPRPRRQLGAGVLLVVAGSGSWSATEAPAPARRRRPVVGRQSAAAGSAGLPSRGLAAARRRRAVGRPSSQRPGRLPGLLNRHRVPAIDAGQPGAGPAGQSLRQPGCRDARELGQRDRLRPCLRRRVRGSSVVGGAAPSAQLSGCVSRLTGGAAPSLVDKASYDGIPAYIIAVPTAGVGGADAVARRPTRSSSRQYRSRASRESPRPSIG